MAPEYVELRALAIGQRFRFFAEDLAQRGPCVLLEKGPGRATIRYEQPTTPLTRTFTARDRHGQLVERTITIRPSGLDEPCALGAQVVGL
ncbi:MAG: hypothetical protein ACRDH5_18880 [bacterium]